VAQLIRFKLKGFFLKNKIKMFLFSATPNKKKLTYLKRAHIDSSFFTKKKKNWKKFVNGHLIIIRLDVPLEKEEEKIIIIKKTVKEEEKGRNP